MQFSCNQDTFSKYLNIVSRIVNSKPGLPILNNILFDAKGGKVHLTATDLEIGINTWIGADVQSEGTITVPAKQLSEFVNSIPSEKVDVTLEKQMLTVSTVNNNAEFHTIPADDYPHVVSIDKEKAVLNISQEDLLKAVKRVAFAAASDDVKPVLTGVRIEIEGKNVSFVAADGLRLSKQTIKVQTESTKDLNILVPVKALQELAFVVSEMGMDDKESVSLYVVEDRNQVVFRFGDVDIVSRLIDGQYPEYRQIIPTGYKTQVSAKKDEFANALKVTNIIARSVLGNKIILELNPKDNQVAISASQSEVGSNRSVFEGAMEGESLKIAFSARFLGDMFNNLDGTDLIFECTESVKPGVFKIKGDDNFIHLIMPMML
ncbi:MAG: polymerase III subunit beta protein [candidate division WS6 bacterium GW2011_GWF2_39_15]|uniref:Beta sliding clamp n=1 Tax=candidate division WS6 bacterium GW2011_GWF2_39_15 TaxID=1619100 RepID=A0A0G0MR25_9BACT|nr:MAG: polymerase III subunit beta protein [candidate division WS6 bacterium GW2011_GWF2_39_15]